MTYLGFVIALLPCLLAWIGFSCISSVTNMDKEVHILKYGERIKILYKDYLDMEILANLLLPSKLAKYFLAQNKIFIKINNHPVEDFKGKFIYRVSFSSACYGKGNLFQKEEDVRIRFVLDEQNNEIMDLLVKKVVNLTAINGSFPDDKLLINVFREIKPINISIYRYDLVSCTYSGSSINFMVF